MEESEQRRERLRAMRMEAAQAEVSSNVGTFAVPHSLSNPLVDSSAIQPAQQGRFDYYTDPMAAFTANKRRGHPDNQITQDFALPPSYSGSAMPQPSSLLPGQRNPEIIPPPAHQLQSGSSFDPRMYQAQGPYNSSAAYGSPRGMASPSPMHQGTPEAWRGPSSHSHGSPRGMVSPFPMMHQGTPEAWRGPSSLSHGSPRGVVSPFPMMHQGTPEAWNGSVGTASYNSPSNASGGGHFFRPGVEPVRSPIFNYGQGRPQWQGNSASPHSGRGGNPGPSSGRGRGRWHGGSMNPGLGHSGGRGRGFHPRGSGPECFYHKSMDENPWQQLQPLVWKKSTASSNNWLPKSIATKKPRVSEPSNKSNSQPSLAEYLAASFNEAVNDAPSS